MKLESDRKCLIIPSDWKEKATQGIARLNSIQPCYFLVTLDNLPKPENLSEALGLVMEKFLGEAALLVLPKNFASSDSIPFWPKLIQKGSQNDWICSLFFADKWDELEHYLLAFSPKIISEPIDVHVSCQYQQPYTTMFELWVNAGSKPYHPGDYFKEDFLLELKKMTGIWVYWGHAEGDRLRGYSHLMVDEIFANSPTVPFLLTLWFTCSTLDPDVEQNIGLSWFLSGKTRCLLASPYKVKTEENQLLGRQFLNSLVQKEHESLAEILLDLIATEDQSVRQVLNQYHHLGNPWVDLKNINLRES